MFYNAQDFGVGREAKSISVDQSIDQSLDSVCQELPTAADMKVRKHTGEQENTAKYNAKRLLYFFRDTLDRPR